MALSQQDFQSSACPDTSSDAENSVLPKNNLLGRILCVSKCLCEPENFMRSAKGCIKICSGVGMVASSVLHQNIQTVAVGIASTLDGVSDLNHVGKNLKTAWDNAGDGFVISEDAVRELEQSGTGIILDKEQTQGGTPSNNGNGTSSGHQEVLPSSSILPGMSGAMPA